MTGLDPDLTKLIERMKTLAPATRPTALDAVDRLRWIEAKPARRRRRSPAVAALVVLVAFAIGATAKYIVDRAVTTLDETKGQPLLRASLLTSLSEICDETGLYDLAEPLAREALEIREKALDPNHPDVTASLSALGNIRRKLTHPPASRDRDRRRVGLRTFAVSTNRASASGTSGSAAARRSWGRS